MFARTVASIAMGAVVLSAACGDSEEGTSGNNQSYAEGRVRMEIEYLDTGLLKGHAYADAAEGWRIGAISVAAEDHEGGQWIVIEPPGEQVGLGTPSANEFFEVRLEELPRGQQVTIRQTVRFENGAGATVERTVEDRWPP